MGCSLCTSLDPESHEAFDTPAHLFCPNMCHEKHDSNDGIKSKTHDDKGGFSPSASLSRVLYDGASLWSQLWKRLRKKKYSVSQCLP